MECKAINAETMGRSNQLVILNLIRKNPGITRRELVQKTGLDPSTVTKIIYKLISKDLIKETGEKRGKGPGRRSIGLSIKKSSATVIISRIGVETTELGLGYIDNSIEILKKLPTIHNRDVFLSQFTDSISEIYFSFRKKYNIVAISVSLPGIVNRNGTYIHILPHLGWKDVEFGEILSRRLPDSDFPILIENEAKLSLLTEITINHKITGLQNGIYVYISQGIGGAFLINGQIFLGHNFVAGEIGHMKINEDGPKCHCGNNGCWETYLSIERINKKYEDLGHKLKGKNSIEKFINLISLVKKDKGVQRVIEEMTYYLSLGIINLVNILNPEFIIIGGMGHLFPDKILEDLKEMVKKRALHPAIEDLKILKSSMGISESTLIGCTISGIEYFSKEAILSEN